ncbi:hypothetical protein DICPUDRAFT_150156 [Dictyostelium purpureum]|uniref:Uncharacterized protein n=1 Tax=Dictyostelium purpureum TaxID=5786 RepID=F0ZFL0_DICPU|nr:uncharacterized protein DICPUDRAFT_150156 [Dictyostelium purpureum]EGC37247.1 hypothetical protein DICPUDRAFT_150156 [Dictyostelium purpureum]|eukprot:XP_003286217.1 hypothetical protein DICPUDRAFT_150156 [Dictyostelium purpureum]
MMDTQFVFSDITQGCNIVDHTSHTDLQRNLLTGVSEDGKLLVDDAQIDSTIESSQFLDNSSINDHNKDDSDKDSINEIKHGNQSFELLYTSTGIENENENNKNNNQNCNTSNQEQQNNLCSNNSFLEVNNNNTHDIHSPSSVSSPQEMLFNDLSESHIVYELLKDMDAIYIVTPNTPISSISIEQINQHKQKQLQQQNQQQQHLLHQQQRQKQLQQQLQQLHPQPIDQIDQIDQIENFLEEDAFKIDQPLIEISYNNNDNNINNNININNNNEQFIIDKQHIFENDIDDRSTKKIKTENISLSESSSVVSSPITSSCQSPNPQLVISTNTGNHYTNNPLLPEQHSSLPTISSLPMQIKPPTSLQHIHQLQNLHSLTPFNTSPSILSLISPTTLSNSTTLNCSTNSINTTNDSNPIITSIGTPKKSKKSLASSTSSTNGSSPGTPTQSNRCTPYCAISTEKNQECTTCQQIRPVSIIHTDGSDSNTCTKWCISSKQRKQKSIGLDFCSICLSRSRTQKYNPQNHQCLECQRPWMMLTASSNLCKRCFKKGQQSK